MGSRSVLAAALLLSALAAAAQTRPAGETGPMPADCPAFDPAFVPSKRPPEYPPAMSEQGLSGVSTLVLAIDRCGRVAEARVERSSGYPEFDQAALAAAMGWRLTPAYSDGKAVTSRVRRPVRFELLEELP